MPSGLGYDEVDFWDGAEERAFCCWDRDAHILLLEQSGFPLLRMSRGINWEYINGIVS